MAFTGALARQRPVAMVLSDLHWADDAVLDVIGGLVECNARLPFVVLATARSSLAERWSPPEGVHHSVVMHLDPLGRDAAAQLLQCLAGDRMATLDEGVVADLLDRASGNPFFLEELVSWLDGSGSTELPATLRGLVAARLDGLTRAERDVLEDAAVLGSTGESTGWRPCTARPTAATAPCRPASAGSRPRSCSPSTAIRGSSTRSSSGRSRTAR